MKRITLSIRSLAAAAVALTLLVGGVSAAASGSITKKMIEANYMGIKLVVDEVEVTPKDASGNVVEPFTSSGTTYLPVRAVANALGKEVTWDGNTRTVYIGKLPGAEENWMLKLPPYRTDNAIVYDGSDHTKFFAVAGVNQTKGVVAEDENGWYRPEVIWNTNGQYSTMTCTVGFMVNKGDRPADMTLEVYLDGVYSTSYTFKYDGAPKTIHIPINYAPNVKVLFTSEEGQTGIRGEWGMYDISFS